MEWVRGDKSIERDWAVMRKVVTRRVLNENRMRRRKIVLLGSGVAVVTYGRPRKSE